MAELFERGEFSLVDRFNVLLGTGIYSKMRQGVFAVASRAELASLHGKRLLDIGCGNGRETAELWLKFGGDIHITAIDPVPGMIEHAEQYFEALLDEIGPNHPPVTRDNRPTFRAGERHAAALRGQHLRRLLLAPRSALDFRPKPGGAGGCSRVVRPGGLILGAQSFKPYANPYFNLVIRGHRNSFGFFWREEYRRWFREAGGGDRTRDTGGLHVRPELQGRSPSPGVRGVSTDEIRQPLQCPISIPDRRTHPSCAHDRRGHQDGDDHLASR